MAMTIRILLLALTIASVVALGGLVWMLNLAEIRLHHLLSFLTHMDLMLTACVVLSVVSAVIGILGVRAGARRRVVIGVGGAFC